MYESKNSFRPEMAKKPSGICYLLALPAILIIFILKIIPFIGAIVLPFKEYTPSKGIMGSPWVGFKNFADVLGSSQFLRVFGNTLILKFEYILICSLIAFSLVLALSLIRSVKLQKFFSVLFLLPYFIPTLVFSYLILQMMSMEGPGFLFLFHTTSLTSTQTFRTAYIAIEVVKNIGVPVIIGLGAINARTGLSSEGGRNFAHTRLIPAAKAVGLFALIQLSAVLTTDFELLNSLYNPLVYEAADTLDTYSYRVGLLQSQYGAPAVVWLIQFIIQLVVSIPAYLLIKSFFTKEVFGRRQVSINPAISSGSPAGSAFGIALGSLAALLLFAPFVLALNRMGGAAGEIEGMVDGSLIGRAFATYIPITLIAVVINGIITALLAYPLTVRNLPGQSLYKIFLIVILSMGNSGIHEYLFYRSLGAINTYIPYLFTGLITIVNVFVIKAICNAQYTEVDGGKAYGREGDWDSFFSKYLPGIWKPLLGLAGLQFITIWNSHAPSQLWYINDVSRFSPVRMFGNMMATLQGGAYKAMAPRIMETGFWVSLPSLVIGILLVVFIGHEIFASQIRKS